MFEGVLLIFLSSDAILSADKRYPVDVAIFSFCQFIIWSSYSDMHVSVFVPIDHNQANWTSSGIHWWAGCLSVILFLSATHQPCTEAGIHWLSCMSQITAFEHSIRSHGWWWWWARCVHIQTFTNFIFSVKQLAFAITICVVCATNVWNSLRS